MIKHSQWIGLGLGLTITVILLLSDNPAFYFYGLLLMWLGAGLGYFLGVLYSLVSED